MSEPVPSDLFDDGILFPDKSFFRSIIAVIRSFTSLCVTGAAVDSFAFCFCEEVYRLGVEYSSVTSYHLSLCLQGLIGTVGGK